MRSIAKETLLRNKYKKFYLSSFNRTKSTQKNSAIFSERIELFKKIIFELDFFKNLFNYFQTVAVFPIVFQYLSECNFYLTNPFSHPKNLRWYYKRSCQHSYHLSHNNKKQQKSRLHGLSENQKVYTTHFFF